MTSSKDLKDSFLEIAGELFDLSDKLNDRINEWELTWKELCTCGGPKFNKKPPYNRLPATCTACKMFFGPESIYCKGEEE